MVPPPLDQTRAELRRLGYLDHGLERFLLQDVLRPRQPGRILALLTAKVGLLCGGLVAVALAVALAVANGNLQESPLDLPLLVLHLLVPASVAAAAAFLALGGAALAVLRFYHVRRIEAVALAASLVAGLAGLLLALWEARDDLQHAGLWQRAALAAGAAVAGYGLVRLVYQGLLALAIRFSARGPAATTLLAWRWRRWVSGAVLAVVLLVAVPVMLAARSTAPELPPLLPMAPGAPVLVIGLDGVLAGEADYLLRHGDLPAMAGLLGARGDVGATGGDEGSGEGVRPPETRSGLLLRYRRPVEPPAAFWTSVATGLPPGSHGVEAVDSFLPLGMRTPLERSGLLRFYWQHVEAPLHLAEYRPLLANRRSAYTFWELAARGGAPVLAVNWWATFPAAPLPGLVLAHDAYQLVQEGVQGAVSDPAAAPKLAAMARNPAGSVPGGSGSPVAGGGNAPGDDIDALLAAALPPVARQQVQRRATWPDEFYRAAFAARLAGLPLGATRAVARVPSQAPQPRAAALYLPGLDIAASGWAGSQLAFAELARGELRAADRLLGELLAQSDWGMVVVVFDPGRRMDHGASDGTVAAGDAGGPIEGRVLIWRRGSPCGASPPSDVTPEALTAGLLRVLGLPQSAELALPPRQCSWPDAPARVARYGSPPPPLPPCDPSLPAGACGDGAEQAARYLQNLRSLGYL